METEYQEFFILQRCWFDGPIVEPPADYLALFSNQAQAEETAYQSAHLHACKHHAVVRTLLLQTGYAFSAAGKLFWVRRVFVGRPCPPQAMGRPALLGSAESIGASLGASIGAHVILTNGVIGGTGNANSRRGSELAYNRVFVGADSSTRASLVMAQESLPLGTILTWIPMGPLLDVTHGWPNRSENTDDAHAMETTDEETSMKRSSMDGQPQQQFHYHATSARPSKRLCHQTAEATSNNSSHGNETSNNNAGILCSQWGKF